MIKEQVEREQENSYKFKIRVSIFLILYVIFLINLFFGFPGGRRSSHYMNLICLFVIPITTGIIISIVIYQKYLTNSNMILAHNKDIAIGFFFLDIGLFCYMITVANLIIQYKSLLSRPDLNPEAYIIYYEVFRFVAIGVILTSLSFLYDGFKFKDSKYNIFKSKKVSLDHIQFSFLILIAGYPAFSLIFTPFFKGSIQMLLFCSFYGYPVLISILIQRYTNNQKIKWTCLITSFTFFIMWFDVVSGSYNIYQLIDGVLIYFIVFGTPLISIISTSMLLILNKKEIIDLKFYDFIFMGLFTLLSFWPLLILMSLGT